jgi:chromosome segregation protein
VWRANGSPKIEQETVRLSSEHEEARKQEQEVRRSLQDRQGERMSIEEKLLSLRGQIEAWTTQRAESQARLDELRSRLESLHARLDSGNKEIETAESLAREAGEKYASVRAKREEIEAHLKQAEEREENSIKEVGRLEDERRGGIDERTNILLAHTRIKTRLEVLEQAEQSLAGYAEGARFLLEAAGQMKLKGARGALSSALDVPAELEIAITSALGDTLDAILLDADGIEDALQLLESNEAGRAVLLPINQTSEVFKTSEVYADAIGIASELVNAPGELRAAVNLMLGQTLIVRDRATARRLLPSIPAYARMVTLRGEVFRGDGLIVAGKSTASSALSRPRQKRELTESLTLLGSQIEALNREIDSLSARIHEAGRELTEAAESVREWRVRLDEAEEVEKQAGLESEAKRRELEWQRGQQIQLRAEADEAEAIQKRLIESQATIEAESVKAREGLQQLSARLSGMDMVEAQGQASYWSTRLAVAERPWRTRLQGKRNAPERSKNSTRGGLRWRSV